MSKYITPKVVFLDNVLYPAGSVIEMDPKGKKMPSWLQLVESKPETKSEKDQALAKEAAKKEAEKLKDLQEQCSFLGIKISDEAKNDIQLLEKILKENRKGV
jgi:hypothetical protein